MLQLLSPEVIHLFRAVEGIQTEFSRDCFIFLTAAPTQGDLNDLSPVYKIEKKMQIPIRRVKCKCSSWFDR